MVVKGTPEFKFDTELSSPEVYYLYLKKDDGDSLNDRILFFGEKGEITINTLLKTFESSAKVTGSKNQDLLQNYNKMARQFDAKNLEYIKSYLEELKNDGNPIKIDSLQKEMDNLLRRRYLYTLNFASTNGDNVIAPYIALTQVNDANIIFLDTIASKLSDKVKKSKYGIEFIDFIKKRKISESLDWNNYFFKLDSSLLIEEFNWFLIDLKASFLPFFLQSLTFFTRLSNKIIACSIIC